MKPRFDAVFKLTAPTFEKQGYFLIYGTSGIHIRQKGRLSYEDF